jgi:hypothetical protein
MSTARAPAQTRLGFGLLACPVCPYGVSGRCEGERAATPESFSWGDPTVIGCTDPARQTLYYADLHGSGAPRRQKAPHSKLVLPVFIPQVPTGLSQIPEFRANYLFSVSLSTILDANGRVKYKSPEALRRALRLPSTARLALIGTAIDHTIEQLWQTAKEQDSWRKIAALRFEFSTSLTYSVWERHPRFDQIISQEKNFATHDILLSHGLISIPFLFFHDDRDYEEIVSWLQVRQDVRKVAVLSQFKHSKRGFEQLLKEMHSLEKDLSRQFHFLVVGPASAARIGKLINDFPKVTIVTHQPIFKAIYGSRILPSLRPVKADIHITKEQLAVNNVEQYWQYCTRRRKSIRAKKGSKQPFMPLFFHVESN